MSYDAVVVGARCAGAATALLLARGGLRVLLVDRASFPSEIPHGHFLHRHGPARLHRWGLLERILATGCPAVTAWRTDLGDGELLATDLVLDGVASGYAPRRAVLDHLLVEAAVEAGAELRERFVLTGVTRDGERVTGVRGRSAGARNEVTEQAWITIGADGRNSRLARQVGAERYDYVPPLTSWYFSYWSGVPDACLELYQRPGRVLFGFPTHDGLFGLFLGWPAAELAAVRADLEASTAAAVARVPQLAERLRAGRREERFYGATDVPNFFRVPWGPGWALVGDAGCHKDPYLALGMCDALRDAELLAGAVLEATRGERPLEAALERYHSARDRATRADFAENLRLASLAPPPPAILRLRAALRADPEQARRFHLAREGMIPPECFFNQGNLRGLVGDFVPEVMLSDFATREVERVSLAV